MRWRRVSTVGVVVAEKLLVTPVLSSTKPTMEKVSKMDPSGLSNRAP
jgi:hypothetical protein